MRSLSPPEELEPVACRFPTRRVSRADVSAGTMAVAESGRVAQRDDREVVLLRDARDLNLENPANTAAASPRMPVSRLEAGFVARGRAALKSFARCLTPERGMGAMIVVPLDVRAEPRA